MAHERSEEQWTAERIKALRAARAWTEEDFARQLGVRVGTVSRWENGHAAPSRLARQSLEKLAEQEEAVDGKGAH